MPISVDTLSRKAAAHRLAARNRQTRLHSSTIRDKLEKRRTAATLGIGRQPLRVGPGHPGGNMATTQDDLIATLQRANAELRRERDAALASRDSRYGEHAAHQAATIEVLKAMSASPGDPQPVFDLIVERACACCGAELAALTLLDGDLLRLNATSGMTAARTQEFATAYPLPVSQAFAGGRAILTRDTVQVPDTQADPGFAQRGTNAWHRSVLAVPLLRAGMPIGAIGLGRSTPGAFSAAQVELLKTFAEQAVIAIGSAETYRKLNQRTADLQESLEYQTATSDVLKVISRSTFDLQPVLDTVVETAARLCDADQAAIFRVRVSRHRLVANFGFPPEYEAYKNAWGILPVDRSQRRGSEPCSRAVPCMFMTWPPFQAIRRCDQARQATDILGRATVARRRDDRNHPARPPTRRAFYRPSDRTRQHVCRSGGDRDREHATDDRTARGTGAADRNRRSVAGDQCLGRRSGAGFRYDIGKGDTALRGLVRRPRHL